MHYLHKYESLEDFENDYFGDKYFEDWVSITRVPPSGPVKKFAATCDCLTASLPGEDLVLNGDMWYSSIFDISFPGNGLWIVGDDDSTVQYLASISYLHETISYDGQDCGVYSFNSNYPGLESGTCLNYLVNQVWVYIVGTITNDTFEPATPGYKIFEVRTRGGIFDKNFVYFTRSESDEIYIEDNFSAATITDTNMQENSISVDYNGVEFTLRGRLIETASIWRGYNEFEETGIVTDIRTIELPSGYEDWYSNSACTVNGRTYYCDYYEEGDGYYWETYDLVIGSWTGRWFMTNEEFLTEGETVTVSARVDLTGFITSADFPQVGDEIMIAEGDPITTRFSTRELNVGDVGQLDLDGDPYPSGATVNTILEYEEGERLAVNYNKTIATEILA